MIIFVGKTEKGGFVSEVGALPDIHQQVRFLMPQTHHIRDLINDILAASTAGCQNIIYDTEEFIDDADVLVDEIVRIRAANGAEPILFVPTTHVNNQIVSEAMDHGLTRFINSAATMGEQKSELIRCITRYYDANEREDLKQIRKAKDERKARMGSFQTIGIMGTCHRIGTTTQAIQIVKYLQSKGYKACYVEMNEIRYPNMQLSRREKPEVSFVEKSRLTFDYTRFDEQMGVVNIEGVDLFYRQDLLPAILEREYDFYVYDYGVYTDRDFNKTSFLKDDIKIIAVGAGAVELDYTLNILQNISYEKALLLFSFTASDDREDLLLFMDDFSAGDRCFFTEYTPNPFVLSNPQLYEEMLDVHAKTGQAEEMPEKQRRGLFRKKNDRKKGRKRRKEGGQ